MPARAICFDLNGTLSDDEGIYFEIFAELFAREGRPISREEYFTSLVGRTDEEAVRLWLGDTFARTSALLEERVARFLGRVGAGETVPDAARQAVRAAAKAGPVAVVSGAFRVEVDAILRGAGLREAVDVIVALEDAERPKPDPEPYVLATAQLGIAPADAVAFEDTAVGVAAAKAAGLRCVGVLGSQDAETLGAGEVVERLDEHAVRAVLG